MGHPREVYQKENWRHALESWIVFSETQHNLSLHSNANNTKLMLLKTPPVPQNPNRNLESAWCQAVYSYIPPGTPKVVLVHKYFVHPNILRKLTLSTPTQLAACLRRYITHTPGNAETFPHLLELFETTASSAAPDLAIILKLRPWAVWTVDQCEQKEGDRSRAWWCGTNSLSVRPSNSDDCSNLYVDTSPQQRYSSVWSSQAYNWDWCAEWCLISHVFMATYCNTMTQSMHIRFTN